MNTYAPVVRTARGLALLAGLLIVTAQPSLAQPGATESSSNTDGAVQAATTRNITVTAVVRDFQPWGSPGGHPDFQRWSGRVRVGMLAPRLDDEAKPVAADPAGHEIVREFRDRQGRPINPALFNPARGDVQGELVPATEPRLESAESFAQWYRDVPGVNAAANVQLTFVHDATTGLYTFDSSAQEPYASGGGFFPINDQLYGNFASTGKNFHFTTELSTSFTVRKNAGQVFTFSGDDDVWVFIDGTLVIDLGGVHGEHEQTVEIDRLEWLREGQVASLRVFHAERRTSGSNFRISTTLALRSVTPAQAAALFD